ncbi:MAG: LLM class flavin-dependent oxidoreductase, partial [Acidimicrobiales bacterium]
AQHHPLDLAKAVASLDVLSAGRVEVGVGYGWNRLELADHGIDWPDRRAAFGEKLAVVRRLWTDEVVSAEGRYVTFAPSWSWPKPVQRPHPPVLVGAAGTDATLADVVELADGWYPLATPEVPAQIGRLRQEAARTGRPAPRITVCAMEGQRPGVAWYSEDGAARAALDELADGYGALGVDRLVVGVPMTDLDALTRGLDVLAALAERVA